MDIVTGRVVKSTAGRDKGKFFVIVSTIDDNHVFIADGHLRKIEKPKKKKLKHLVMTSMVYENFNERKQMAGNTFNAELEKYIASIAN